MEIKTCPKDFKHICDANLYCCDEWQSQNGSDSHQHSSQVFSQRHQAKWVGNDLPSMLNLIQMSFTQGNKCQVKVCSEDPPALVLEDAINTYARPHFMPLATLPVSCQQHLTARKF